MDAALESFGLDVRGWVCADFGCNVGGFTDCLLRRGAAKVYAIDTGYGELAWKLRKDPRVVVMERTNALYCEVSEAVDLVTIDMAWTPQALSVPAARRWLKSSPPAGQIISLLKPHYEAVKMDRKVRPEFSAVLSLERAREVCLEVCRRLEENGPCQVRAAMQSALKGKGGNLEFLLLLSPL